MYVHALGLDLDTPAHRARPHEIYARMRSKHPAATAKHPFFGEVRVLTRYDDVQAVMRHPQAFSSRHSLDPGARKFAAPWLVPRIIRLFDESMACSDAPKHTHLRKLVTQVFTPRRVAAFAERIEAVTHELLDRALAERRVDFIDAFALPLPLRVIGELLGVRDDEMARFRALLTEISRFGSGGMLAFVRQLPRGRQFVAMIEQLIQRRRAEPDEGFLSALIEAEQDGASLSADELLGMVFLLLFAGHETTVNLIANGVLAFIEHPEQWQRLSDAPEQIGPAIEEIIRYDGPTEHVAPRYLGEAIDLPCGRRLERGEVVIPVILAANRDPDAFADPTTFDIARDAKHHLGFGFGVHYCVGAPLARLEGKLAFTALRQRVSAFRLTVPRDEIRWRPGLGVHGPLTLPIELEA